MRQRVWRLLAAICLLPAWPFIWAADLCLRLGRARLVDTLVTPADEQILRWLEDKREQRFH